MDAAERGMRAREFDKMSQDESIFTNPEQEMVPHVRDYSWFTKMFKYGAIVCFVIAMIVLIIISN